MFYYSLLFFFFLKPKLETAAPFQSEITDIHMNSETSSKCYTKWWEGALKLISTEEVGTKNRLPQPLHTHYIRIINCHWSFNVGHHIATVRFLHESELLHGQLLYFPGSAPRTEALTLFLRRMMRQPAWAPQKTQKTSTSRADWPRDNPCISWALCILDQ